MRDSKGFSLVELMIVLVVMAIMLGITVPAYRSMSQSQQLHGAAESIGRTIQLARTRAMATGRTQTLNFDTSTNPPSVFVVDAVNSSKWTLPRGITFAAGGSSSFTVTNDGRASASVYLVLQNRKGLLDTISVESSGLVLAR